MIPTLPRFGLRKLSSSFKITVSIVLDYKDIIAPSIGFSAKLPSDVARIAIDGCKWIASRFHPVMFSERAQLHLTVNKDNLQEEHLKALKALKARAQKRLEEQNRQKCFNPK